MHLNDRTYDLQTEENNLIKLEQLIHFNDTN